MLSVYFVPLMGFFGIAAAACTCKNPDWCKSIDKPLPEKEVFTFITSHTNWPLYDWNKITTIAAFMNPIDAELICFAHSKGVRVVYGTAFPGANLTSGPNRHTWVQQQVNYIQTNYLDGINVDFEETIAKTNQAERDGLSLLMWELYGSLKKINPYYQITFDTPYFPETESGRVFDYLEMAQVVDFYMIMAYDMSEVSKPWANCPLNLTEWGVSQFIAAGIPASKLVLGVPWYGYDYPCSKIVNNVCTLAAKGSQVIYAVIAETLFPQAIGGRFFDNDAKSPFFNYKENKTGLLHQIWYDDPQSLMYKYQFATNKNLRGVGMWTADSLDYGNSTTAKKLRAPMWEELP